MPCQVITYCKSFFATSGQLPIYSRMSIKRKQYTSKYSKFTFYLALLLPFLIDRWTAPKQSFKSSTISVIFKNRREPNGCQPELTV